MKGNFYSHLVDTSRVGASDIPENLAVNVTKYNPSSYTYELGIRVNGTQPESFQTSNLSNFSRISNERKLPNGEKMNLKDIAESELPILLGPLFGRVYVFVDERIHRRPITSSPEHQ